MSGAVTGIVLAGGRSTRMGQDKASLPWAESDLLHTVLSRLAPVCRELIVVSNLPRGIALPAVRVVPDNWPGLGPLAGIQAGLAAAATEYAFIAACDMPLLSPAAVELLSDMRDGHDVVVPYIGGRMHPLHALYARRCLPLIEDMLTGGRCRIRDLYGLVSTRLVTAEELQCADPSLLTLEGVNTAADVSRLGKH